MPDLPVDPCLRLVRESIEDFSRDEMSEIIAELKVRQDRLLAQGIPAAEAARRAGQELSDTLKMAARIERRNAAINRRIRLEQVDRLRINWRTNMAEGVLSILFGSPRSVTGSRDSVHAAQSANFRRYMAGIEEELERAGLFDLVRRREMDPEIAEALWRIDDDAALASFSPQAVSVARILDKWREVARLEANRAGAWIGKAKNYITRQTHEPDKLLKAGFDAWKDFTLPRLDLDRMFENGMPADLNAWMHEAFNNLTSGIRPRSPLDSTAERMSAFKGPSNLAKKMSQDRVFHFLDASKWYEYNQEFGTGSLIETFINDLHRRAESTGMMQVLGTNPEYNLDAIVKAVRTELSRTDVKALRKFDRATRRGRRIDNAFLEVSGFTRTVASTNLATVGSFLRAWNTLSSLGAAVMASITDVPLRASTLRYQGQNYLGALNSGLVAPLRRLFGTMHKADRRAAIHAAGYFNDVAMRNLLSRFAPDENVNGKIHRAVHTFFKWNLLGPWTDEMRRSSIESMALFHGSMSGKEWGQLSPRVQSSLARYNITDANWDVIRQGIVETDDGKFLTPDAVRQLPLDNFTEIASQRIEGVQRGLLERVKRRLKADARERGWVDSRHSRFTAALEDANERLLQWATRRENRLVSRRELLAGRAERAEARGTERAATAEQRTREQFVDRVIELNKRMGELRVQLDDLTDWWKYHFDMDLAPEYGQRLIRWAGNQEGTLRAKQAQAKREYRRNRVDFNKRMDEINTELAALKSEIEAKTDEGIEAAEDSFRADVAQRYEDFNNRWQQKYADLKEFMKEMDERMQAREADNSLDLEAHEGNVQRVLDNARAETADKLQRFYADEVDSAVISPDARAMSLVRQGTQLGTPMGEVLRAFWQFKTFSIGVFQRGLMREFYGYDYGKGGRFGTSEIRGLATMMVGSTAFGYLAMTLKDMLRGREPRPVNNPSTWVDAMAQGGSLGIYGDFLLGTQAKFGRGFLATMGGPMVSKSEDLYKMYGAVRNGDDPRAQALRFAINNTPYNNLFYTRLAADYLFLYELQEAMNPGYLMRYENRISEETGAEWWAPPTEAIQ